MPARKRTVAKKETASPQPEYVPTQYAPMQSESVPAQKKKGTGIFLIISIIVGVLVFLAAAFGAVTLGKDFFNSVFYNSSGELTDKQTKEIITEIGRIAVLPDETPQMGVVSDAEEMKKQSPFFANVENGDIIVGYIQHKQIIIYRPRIGKIVNMSTLTADE